ncbi:hypothetical protein GCM10027343_34030 [Noviherbaspirillum agri]
MQTLSYNVGKWHAEAMLEELETGKLMAVISVTDDKNTDWAGSRHTVVFELGEGEDKREGTEVLVRRLLQESYGLE